MAKIILALGGNLGNPVETFSEAVKSMENSFINEIAVSSIYKTTSLLHDSQPDYYNAVLTCSTALTPHELLSKVKELETHLGRTFRGVWKERLIDIDIIDYDSTVIDTDNLSIPHIRMHERSFVLLPLLEIFPEYRHPKIPLSLKEIYDMIEDKLGIKKECEFYLK